MVALYHLARDVETLDAVRVYSALSQPFCSRLLLRLGVEHLYEVPSDNLALLFRICHSCQVGEEFLARVHTDNVQTQALVILHHVAELVLAQHTMVYEDTGEVLAYCLVEQYSGNA